MAEQLIKAERSALKALQTMPNVGPAMARDLLMLGFTSPEQLRDADPLELYHRLCEKTKVRQDPCVLDTFMAVVDFANTGVPKPWWEFTEERKRRSLLG